MRLANKIAIITGSGSGIGAATAKRFVEEGATVVVADKNLPNAEKVAAALGQSARAIACDVSKSDQVQALIEGTAKRHGRLDILINNAGYGIKGSVVETSEADWDALMSVNIKGVFLGCKYAIPIMVAQGGGAIVNTASTTSRIGIPDRAAYVTSKGAVAAMTRAMALDHVHQNVRINAVGPGTVGSSYFDALLKTAPDPAALRKSLEVRQAMNRLGTPLEIANAILYLASDEASFTTGTVLYTDGGWTAR
jgi:meso-butanediol dehydrogenase / (S,S)-butanediol dehydrogenase / diacetyl reductase